MVTHLILLLSGLRTNNSRRDPTPARPILPGVTAPGRSTSRALVFPTGHPGTRSIWSTAGTNWTLWPGPWAWKWTLWHLSKNHSLLPGTLETALRLLWPTARPMTTLTSLVWLTTTKLIVPTRNLWAGDATPAARGGTGTGRGTRTRERTSSLWLSSSSRTWRGSSAICSWAGTGKMTSATRSSATWAVSS